MASVKIILTTSLARSLALAYLLLFGTNVTSNAAVPPAPVPLHSPLLLLKSEQSHIKPEQALAKSEQTAALIFQFETTNNRDSNLIETLKFHSVFEKLELFTRQNLHLKNNISFYFRNSDDTFPQSFSGSTSASGSTSYFEQDTDTTKQDYEIIIPFSFLHKLDQGLKSKYPEQQAVRERIYATAVEKFLWFEFGRALVNQYTLAISGQEVFALDNFSTLMLVNLDQLNSDYILDATEAYLLIDHTFSLTENRVYESESEFDEHRYRRVVCLILGKDLADKHNHSEAPYAELLSELAWDNKRQVQCQQHYQNKLLAWFEALRPHLKENNQFNAWLEDRDLSKTEEKVF